VSVQRQLLGVVDCVVELVDEDEAVMVTSFSSTLKCFLQALETGRREGAWLKSPPKIASS